MAFFDARCGTIASSRLLSFRDVFLSFSILAPSRYPINGACTCTSGEMIFKIRTECYLYTLFSPVPISKPCYPMQFYFIALQAQQSAASLSSSVPGSCSKISAEAQHEPGLPSPISYTEENRYQDGARQASACRHQACKNQGRERQQAENISTK